MRRIKSIEVENFKSLVKFKIELSKFSCLIGLNGAGKSTVLQFIDFLSQLVRGDMKGWLKERGWTATDLKSKLTGEEDVTFCIRFVDEQGKPAGRWEASYSPSLNRCTRERIDTLDFLLEATEDEVKLKSKVDIIKLPSGKDSRAIDIAFDIEGSILSTLKEGILPAPILECRNLFVETKSLELLAPELLRQRTRESSGELGLGGQKLAAFLHEMSTPQINRLRSKLTKHAYPALQGLEAKSVVSGWKQIEILESYEGQEGTLFPEMTTEARHINDGMLRLIAILAELQSEHSFSLFDEIENGINPELIEFVLDELVTTPKQVLVTTHSPMILNYLDDDVATNGVIYLYKTRQGHTLAIPFFSIPSLKKKLKVMGPGEAFVDTDLTALSEEIEEFTEGR